MTECNFETKSKIQYHIQELVLYGIGQALVNWNTYRNFISIPMMELVEEVAPKCIINLKNSKEIWAIKTLGFADKRYYVNKK